MNARIMIAFRWLARLAGHAEVEPSGSPYRARSHGDGNDVDLWLRPDGTVDVDVRGISLEQADHLIRMHRQCGLCEEPTPAWDRIKHEGRPAHTACVVRENLRARITRAAPLAPPVDPPTPPPQPLTLRPEGCICRLPPCGDDLFIAVDMNPSCAVHRADVEAIRAAAGARRRGPAS